MKELTVESCIRQEVDIRKLRSLQHALKTRSDLDQLADLLAMAGNATRLKILFLLAKGEELCVCDMADVMGMTVSAISHQLRKLRDRKVIASRRDGPTIFYRLQPGPFKDVLLDLFNIDD
jgi:DNA-binding transcriptional ArsR family regulator